MAFAALVPIATEIGGNLLKQAIGGGNVRAGGADPCCPPGYNPSGVWPRNSNVDGAPPDYRTKGAPMTDPSPSGVGRLKDDFCDCVPIKVRGRLYMLGWVRDGVVYTGAPDTSAARNDAVWVEVNSKGQALRVPGVGVVGSAPTPTSSGGGGTVVPSPGAPSSTGNGATVPLASSLAPTTAAGKWAIGIPLGFFVLKRLGVL